MRTITKIFNNNIVSAVGEDGEDVILVGAGVGYLASKGHVADESRIEREFHLTGALRGGAYRILVELPYDIITAVSAASQDLAQRHGVVLTAGVEVALADHISQAVTRARTGTSIYNSMLWETKMTYPREFAMALEVLDVIRRELGTKLPLDEAGFVALHLAHSGLLDTPESGLALGATLHDIIELVETELGVSLDQSSPTITRFLTHVKFVVQRVTRSQTYSGEFDDFFAALKKEREHLYLTAVHIGDYLADRYGASLSEEEHMYLVLHLYRLEAELDPRSISEGTLT